ncbi:hypothetical protein EVC24_148 [Rhizobium phage RHph_I4]|nr:hypothetical protein EVC24_148 [Rhizobium phage RHph_I4]
MFHGRTTMTKKIVVKTQIAKLARLLKPVEPTEDEIAHDQKVRKEAARNGGVY